MTAQEKQQPSLQRIISKKGSSLMGTVFGTQVRLSIHRRRIIRICCIKSTPEKRKKIKKEKNVYSALEAKFPPREDAPNEFTYMEEMSAVLMDDSDDTEDDEEKRR